MARRDPMAEAGGDQAAMDLDPAGAILGDPAGFLGDGVDDGILGDILMRADMDGVGSAIPAAGQDVAWREQGILEQNDPGARPGYRNRWVRVHTVDGRPDAKNLEKRLRQGYRPRAAETLPPGRLWSTRRLGEVSVLQVNGMILMEIREEDARRLDEIKARRTAHLSGAVNLDGSAANLDRRYARLNGKAEGRVTVGYGGDREAVGRSAEALID